MGRPKKWTDEYVQKLRKDMTEYLEETEIPVMSEFSWKYKYPRARLYTEERIADLVEYMQVKKESQLEKKALIGQINPTMAVFSLKQMGWKDRHETDNRHSITERKIVYVEDENNDV